MSSKTQICNLAISHIGIGNEISSLETDRSAEAAACRRYFDIALENILSDFPWPFATKFIALGLVELNPTNEWSYSYRYPSDCLKIRRILSGIRNDTRQSRVPYKIAQDDNGSLIYTDMSEALIEYTVRLSDVERLPSDVVLAMSYYLASLIAPRILGSDRFEMVKRALQLYEAYIGEAKASAANEEQADEEVYSEFERVRNGLEDSRFDSFRPL